MTHLPAPSARHGRAILVVLVLFTLLGSGWPAPPQRFSGYLPIVSRPAATDQARLAMVHLVNDARVAQGCPAATIDPRLMHAAQGWSQAMVTTEGFRHSFEHDPDWLSHYGFIAGDAGEAIAVGSLAAAPTFAGWWASPAHQAILLRCANPSWWDFVIGVGAVRHPETGATFWTLYLGTLPKAALSTR